MNRSFSKIRHIQESNLILEKRLLNEQTTTGGTETKTYNSLSDYLVNVPNIKSRLSPKATHKLLGTYFSSFGMISVNLKLIDIQTGGILFASMGEGQGTDISKFLFDALNNISTKITEPNITISSNEFPLPPDVTINGVTNGLEKS